MLKCAEAHNLSPAQLEKLGQTFNTAKTIVGLEKQANRGDSFKIVDVPSLISKYASYSPAKALSNKSKKVHEKVDSLFDDQDGWGACLTSTKKASTGLPNLRDMFVNGGVVDETEQEEKLIDSPYAGATWKWNVKMASADTREKVAAEGNIKLAAETLEQLQFEIPMDITEKCAAIKFMLTPDDGRWAEAAEDIHDLMGEKSAAVIEAVETYFANTHHSYEKPVEFAKRAFARNLAQDRHGILKIASEIAELQELMEKVATQAATAPSPIVQALAEAVQQEQPTPSPKGQSQKRRNRQGSSAGNNPPSPQNNPQAGTRVKADDELHDGVKDEPVEDYTILPAADLTALLDAMGPAAKGIIPQQEDVFNTKPIDTLESILGKIGPKSDSRAKAIDSALRQAQMDTTLQQLMLSDDVIADADPTEVQELFKTLASVSPSLATDPGKMGPALKEALQYGSVPINILSDASKLEGQLLKNDLERANVERNKYSL